MQMSRCRQLPNADSNLDILTNKNTHKGTRVLITDNAQLYATSHNAPLIKSSIKQQNGLKYTVVLLHIDSYIHDKRRVCIQGLYTSITFPALLIRLQPNLSVMKSGTYSSILYRCERKHYKLCKKISWIGCISEVNEKGLYIKVQSTPGSDTEEITTVWTYSEWM